MDAWDLIRLAARQLGYQEYSRSMVKPFGYSFIVIRYNTDVPVPFGFITTYFKDLKGKISTYNDRRIWDEGDTLEEVQAAIKLHEAYTRVNLGDTQSDFRLPGTEVDL